MTVSNYAKLFCIQVIHEFYHDPNDVWADLEIKPDEETARLMSSRRMGLKINENTLLCLIETPATIVPPLNVVTVNRPLFPLENELILNFQLNLKSSRFFHLSNLHLFNIAGHEFKFSNSTGFNQGGNLNLSRQIPAYNAADTYVPGHLVRAGGVIFRAIQASDATNQHNTGDNGFWEALPDARQYVSQADLAPVVAGEEKCFARIEIKLERNMPNGYSLLRQSVNPVENNLIEGRDYVLRINSFA